MQHPSPSATSTELQPQIDILSVYQTKQAATKSMAQARRIQSRVVAHSGFMTCTSSAPTSKGMKRRALQCASMQTGISFAKELSFRPDLRLCVCDRSPPARRSSGKAAEIW